MEVFVARQFWISLWDRARNVGLGRGWDARPDRSLIPILSLVAGAWGRKGRRGERREDVWEMLVLSRLERVEECFVIAGPVSDGSDSRLDSRLEFCGRRLGVDCCAEM